MFFFARTIKYIAPQYLILCGVRVSFSVVCTDIHIKNVYVQCTLSAYFLANSLASVYFFFGVPVFVHVVNTTKNLSRLVFWLLISSNILNLMKIYSTLTRSLRINICSYFTAEKKKQFSYRICVAHKFYLKQTSQQQFALLSDELYWKTV